MMNEQKIDRMFQLAETIVAKCKVNEPRISQHGMFFPQDLVAVLVEGRLRGQLFATYTAVTADTFKNQDVKNAIISRMPDVWRSHAMDALVPLDTLVGPKGKLPA